MPFEVLMIEKLGGRKVLEEVLGKRISHTTTDTLVYQWQDVGKPVDHRVGNFLARENRSDFNQIYEEERNLQLAAMKDDQERVRGSVFAAELE